MNWLRKMMYGRYGADQLNLCLLVVAIALTFISMFVPVPFISYASLIPLIFSIYRMFSKNIAKRQQENYKYLKFVNGIKNYFKNFKGHMQDRKHYKYFTCPQCKKKLRVPKGKGKVKVSCPQCKTSFIKNS